MRRRRKSRQRAKLLFQQVLHHPHTPHHQNPPPPHPTQQNPTPPHRSQRQREHVHYTMKRVSKILFELLIDQRVLLYLRKYAEIVFISIIILDIFQKIILSQKQNLIDQRDDEPLARIILLRDMSIFKIYISYTGKYSPTI